VVEPESVEEGAAVDAVDEPEPVEEGAAVDAVDVPDALAGVDAAAGSDAFFSDSSPFFRASEG